MKLIIHVSSVEAPRIVELAKTLPGVTYAKKYMVGGGYHVLVSGNMTEEVCKKIQGRYKNLAESKKRK